MAARLAIPSKLAHVVSPAGSITVHSFAEASQIQAFSYPFDDSDLGVLVVFGLICVREI